MRDLTLQKRLWENPTYRGLSSKRRQLASAIILDNKTLYQACKAIGGLNQTREAACVDLQVVLAEFAPADEPKAKLEPWEDEKAEALEAFDALVERLEGNPRPQQTTNDAVYAAELATGQVHTVPDAGLDAQRVARMTGMIRRRMNELTEMFRAADARIAEKQTRTICSACQGAITEPRSIAGVDVLCSSCGAKVPHAAKAPEPLPLLCRVVSRYRHTD